MPKLEQWEIKKYWEIFRGLKPENNKLNGTKLGPVFKNSHLEQEQLGKIWKLADIDQDGELDFEEFCISMRLIFDLVNGNMTSVPANLPDWLIPGSKRGLLQGSQGSQPSSSSKGSSGGAGTESDTDDEYSLSSDFDWYISPSDKSSYEDVYNSSCDNYGRITYNSLEDLYKTLSKVPKADISYAWNIVNPKQSQTIDKDQCLVFLHMLNQRSNGKRVPRSIPASLRATFAKETPEFDPDSKQDSIAISDAPEEKRSFASDYLKKLGSSQQSLVSNGTNFDETKGTDWEEVKLKRELEDLNTLLKKAEEEKNKKGQDDKLSMMKYEFEQLLKYKEEQLEQLEGSKNRGSDLSSITNNISSIESQVTQLESFLLTKQNELSKLNREIEGLK